MSHLEDLKKAKQYSDVKQYDEKNQLIHKMITDTPSEFYIDSDKDGIVGLTHESTGFKIHVPKQVVSGVNLQNKAAASLAPMTAGFGMPNITGGGQGSYLKLPSLTGSMKSQLTTATKRVGEKAKTPTPADSMFPATAEHYRKQQELNGYKAGELTTGSISRGLGYSPGLWYNEQDYSPAAQTRYGNIVSGLGLSAAGLASIPVLQYLFPERFKNKGRALSTLAVLGGMAAPWACGCPRGVDGPPLLRRGDGHQRDALVCRHRRGHGVRCSAPRMRRPARPACGHRDGRRARRTARVPRFWRAEVLQPRRRTRADGDRGRAAVRRRRAADESRRVRDGAGLVRRVAADVARCAWPRCSRGTPGAPRVGRVPRGWSCGRC